MPEARLARTRKAYVEGLRHGHNYRVFRPATNTYHCLCGAGVSVKELSAHRPWRMPSENAAEQLKRQAFAADRDLGDETPWAV